MKQQRRRTQQLQIAVASNQKYQIALRKTKKKNLIRVIRQSSVGQKATQMCCQQIKWDFKSAKRLVAHTFASEERSETFVFVASIILCM